MDKSKHTVTIPISDYEQLVKNNADTSEMNENLLKHLKMIAGNGIIIHMNIAKSPQNISARQEFTERGAATIIQFTY